MNGDIHKLPLSASTIARINREHLIQTDLCPADLLFVFGTREGVREFVEEAARLWESRFFKRAIVTGGNTPGGPESEAVTLKGQMIEAGIPSDVILTEECATNTGENVIFSLPILEREVGLANIHSLIAIGKLCTSRRYLMTLQRHWPKVKKMLVAINWFGVPREEWHLHARSRDRILSEYQKIEPYRAQGFLAEWPVSDV